RSGRDSGRRRPVPLDQPRAGTDQSDGLPAPDHIAHLGGRTGAGGGPLGLYARRAAEGSSRSRTQPRRPVARLYAGPAACGSGGGRAAGHRPCRAGRGPTAAARVGSRPVITVVDPRLPYGFAKTHGVLLLAAGEVMAVGVREGADPLALVEARRALSRPLEATPLSAAAFDRKLSEVYAGEQLTAADGDDLSLPVGLDSLVDDIPAA